MSDQQTAHYDTFQNTGRSVMVLDSIRAVCEAINNDALAATKEQPIMAGIENNCSTLGSHAQQYTTIPLRPLTGDCNFLLQNYIHHRIPFSCTLTSEKITAINTTTGVETPSETAADGNLTEDLDFAIYFLSSALIPKRFQLMIGNTVIYQNTFQRTEATVMINSLPPDVVERSDDITTMSKLLERKNIPGQYFTWPKGTHELALNFEIDTFIDLQRFAPIISNLAFIPIEYGDLKLRLFYEDLYNALDITVLPSNRNSMGIDTTKQTISHNTIGVLERRPLMAGVTFVEPTVAVLNSTGPAVENSGGKTLRWTINKTSANWGNSNMSTLVEIVQSTFRLREESKILLKNYIMQDNRLIIPTHTWSTALALGSPAGTNGAQLMWNFTAYNIDMLAFTFPVNSDYESYLPNPLFKSFDVKLNSKSVNFIPYNGVNDARFVKDTKQAFLNTDEFSTNENLTCSLKPYNAMRGNLSTAGNLRKAVYDAYKIDSPNIVYKPNTFCYAINLTPPNSFEKGMCVASSNPQAAQLRITYSTESTEGSPYDGATTILDKYNPLWSDVYKYGNSIDVPPRALALQGCCLVLIYNPIVGACQAGEVVFVEPFLN